MAWICLSGCSDGDEEEGALAATDRHEEAIPVSVTEITRGSISSYILANATLRSEHQVEIVSEVPGAAQQVKVEEGDAVRQGRLLAVLANPKLEIVADRARINMERLEGEAANQKPLYEKGIISQKAFDEVQFQLEQTRLEVRRTREDIQNLRVVSTIKGTVTGRYLDRGETVAPGRRLFTVTDLGRLLAEIRVPEGRISELQVGQVAEVVSAALADKPFPGRVERISPVVDARSGTVKVTIRVPGRGRRGDGETRRRGEGKTPGPGSMKVGLDPGASRGAIGSLAPGMFVRVKLITATHDRALLVNKRALVYDEKRPAVFRLDDQDRVERCRIETGIDDGEWVEVLRGLEEKDQVVVQGQAALKEGSLVRIVGDTPKDASQSTQDASRVDH